LSRVGRVPKKNNTNLCCLRRMPDFEKVRPQSRWEKGLSVGKENVMDQSQREMRNMLRKGKCPASRWKRKGVQRGQPLCGGGGGGWVGGGGGFPLKNAFKRGFLSEGGEDGNEKRGSVKRRPWSSEIISHRKHDLIGKKGKRSQARMREKI